jgi:hypothetical protein
MDRRASTDELADDLASDTGSTSGDDDTFSVDVHIGRVWQTVDLNGGHSRS